MEIESVIGILVIRCWCGQKFVVDTEAVKAGFQYACPACPRGNWINSGSTMAVTLRSNPYGSSKGLGKNNNAMTLEEYKARLAEKILGKKPKVPAKSKNVISFEDSGVNAALIVEVLQGLGYKEKEIMAKIDVAVKDGFFQEDEIIKYILSLK